MSKKVVLDTNVFVASLFNPKSNSAKIIRDIEKDKLDLIWDEPVYKETKKIIEQIPPIEWKKVSALFTKGNKFSKSLDEEEFGFVDDPLDRKFIALSKKTNSILITNDNHLLSVRNETDVQVYTPKEFISEIQNI